MNEETSIKALIQSLIPDGPGIVEGIVTSAKPLKITLKNDAKMVLTSNSLVVPRYLTDHQVEVDVLKSNGKLVSQTKKDEGEHKHEHGEHDGHIGGDGSHIHEDDGKHIHHLSTFDLTNGVLCVYNALKVGETVLLFAYNGGKRFLVLDRKED